ncbi:right-handed parallel beta-helix repeat-containing protein [Haladaptatus halobius]|uniref:right-handed parallel beta-helix repeat-containing protein n=1 Tax=Haladaptatus halobius TaxID=2884875 RepID=UPI001D0AECCB|nr:right-handed parallel beta-helix repeat-containing protein [Haladaptatus halobius]
MSFTKQIDSRTRITRPGIYTLGQDILRGGGTYISESCIQIASDNVVLDGAGHTIDGRGVSDTTGIVATAPTGLENILVTNVTVTDWDRGLYFKNVARGVVHNVHIIGNGYGTSFENVRDIVLNDCRISGNLLGIGLDSPSDTTLRNITIESNHGRDVFHRSDCET